MLKTKEALPKKIKSLQKQIKECVDDVQAIDLQKQLIDLFRILLKDKEALIELIRQQKR